LRGGCVRRHRYDRGREAQGAAFTFHLKE
jgi:hypothetical protein